MNYSFINLILMIFLLVFPFSSSVFSSVKGAQSFFHKANILKYTFQFQKLDFCNCWSAQIWRSEELTINTFYVYWFYFWMNTDVQSWLSKHGFCMTVMVGQQGVYIKLSLCTFRDSWKQFITSYKLINSGFCLAFSWCRVSSHLPTILQTDKKICIAFPIKAPCLPCQQCTVSLGLNQLEDFSGI